MTDAMFYLQFKMIILSNKIKSSMWDSLHIKREIVGSLLMVSQRDGGVGIGSI